MLAMLFVISTITSLMYILKLISVFKYHEQSSDEYREHALPAVRQFQIWNSIFAVALVSCGWILLTKPGRVCAGWYLLGNDDR